MVDERNMHQTVETNSKLHQESHSRVGYQVICGDKDCLLEWITSYIESMSIPQVKLHPHDSSQTFSSSYDIYNIYSKVI